MRDSTQDIIRAALSADNSVGQEQQDAAFAILNGRVPEKWPAFFRQRAAGRHRTRFADTEPATVVPSGKQKADKAYYTRSEAADYLGMSVRLLDLLKSRGDLPFIRASRRKVMFARSDLDELMQARRVDVSEDL